MSRGERRRVARQDPLAPISLLKLIIVFAILGIIAAIAIPPDNPSYIKKSKNLEEQKRLQEIERVNSGSAQFN